MDVQHRLQPLTLARKCGILHWLPCGADRLMANKWIYSHEATKISWMDKQPAFLSYGALLARTLHALGALL